LGIRRGAGTGSTPGAYPHQALPTHKRYGEGERYQCGATLADVYRNPPELMPVVQIRMVKGFLAVGDVLHVLLNEAGGLHVDHANGACEIGKTGDLAYVYTAPQPEVRLQMSQDGYTRKDVYGRSYTQSSLEVEGTPEGVRVTIFGVVEAAPKPVNSKRGSPLQFFLVENKKRWLHGSGALPPYLECRTARRGNIDAYAPKPWENSPGRPERGREALYKQPMKN
jgi:hypothetical protein